MVNDKKSVTPSGHQNTPIYPIFLNKKDINKNHGSKLLVVYKL